MPYERPALVLLIGRAQADIEFVLQNGAAFERRTFEAATARVVAGSSSELHGNISWTQRQSLASTADEKALVEMAGLRGVERKAATKSKFTVLVTGTIALTPIPESTVLSRADGITFVTTVAAALPSSAPFDISVAVQAVVPGSAGNTVPSTTNLVFTNPIPGVSSEAQVEGLGLSPIGDGTDLEDLEVFRARFIRFLQTPPKGGAPGDYVTWALEVSGITRAWERPLLLGPGTVLVFVVKDVFDAAGFFVETTVPGTEKLLELAAHLRLRHPVVVNSYITDIEAYRGPNTPFATVDPTIQISPNTVDLQTAVTRELNDLLLREAAVGQAVLLSKIRSTVSNTAGIIDSIIISPATDVSVSSAGDLITLGTPVYGPIPP